MIDIVFLLRRRSGMSPQEFRRYWREQHGPLVASHADALRIRRYAQLHTLDSAMNQALQESRNTATDVYDGVAQVSFDSLDDLTVAATTAAGRAASEALLEDERRFLDITRCAIWVAERNEVIA